MSKNLRQIEQLDDFRQGNFLAIPFGRPSEQREIIHDRFRHVAFFAVSGKRGPFVAFAHFGAVNIQDQGNVGVFGRLDAERPEECDMLGGVA